MISIEILTLLSFFGVIHGFYLSLYIWFAKSKTNSSKLFAVLIFTISLRLLKNIIYHLSYNPHDFTINELIWQISINIGMASHFAIGPALYLYIKYRLSNTKKVLRSDYLHFSIALLVIVSSFLIPPVFWQGIGNRFSDIHLSVYLILSVYMFLQSNDNSEIYRWIQILLIISTIVIISSFINSSIVLMEHNTSLAFILFIYPLSFILLKNKQLLYMKYMSSSFDIGKSDSVIIDLNNLMIEEKLYRNSKLSLTDLSIKLNISTNHLSQIINSNFNQSFNDFLNRFRVNDVISRLENNQNKVYTLAHIAFESGFESISTFNSVFKKFTKMSPSRFSKSID